MKIYITRHSKTLWNKEGRLQGSKDSVLLQEGIDNAFKLKEYIKDIDFDYIYSSPILRAYQTAKILFKEDDIICDKRLAEMNFGVFEGRRTKDIVNNAQDCEIYKNLWAHPEKFTRIPQGESYDEVVIRVKSFLNELEQKDSNSQIMIVTHGMYFIVLLATMLKLKRADYVKLNQQVVEGCSLTLIHYENDEYRIEYYNDHHFLPHSTTPSFIK